LSKANPAAYMASQGKWSIVEYYRMFYRSLSREEKYHKYDQSVYFYFLYVLSEMKNAGY
jgi:hypothetical protein